MANPHPGAHRLAATAWEPEQRLPRGLSLGPDHQAAPPIGGSGAPPRAAEGARVRRAPTVFDEQGSRLRAVGRCPFPPQRARRPADHHRTSWSGWSASPLRDVCVPGPAAVAHGPSRPRPLRRRLHARARGWVRRRARRAGRGGPGPGSRPPPPPPRPPPRAPRPRPRRSGATTSRRPGPSWRRPTTTSAAAGPGSRSGKSRSRTATGRRGKSSTLPAPASTAGPAGWPPARPRSSSPPRPSTR